MKNIVLTAFVSGTALALTACGDSSDASNDAEAVTVEEPAAAALEDVTEEPVEDVEVAQEAVAPPVSRSVEVEAETATEEAEATVADIEALLNEAENNSEVSQDTSDSM